ncbi:peptidase M66 [Burkholderia ubonensis]|uniref:M66 family metalloprotease n=1 Tax=Burkholderia ubonensis TaxID=101571 RepID=UPI00075C3A3E|nr:M66 family metalloprotease [Burkholderia ubonensis]KVP76742.1 peptidase M66 [Burkholderia ubonensis]
MPSTNIMSRAPVVAVSLAFLLAACGGDGSSPASPDNRPQHPPRGPGQTESTPDAPVPNAPDPSTGTPTPTSQLSVIDLSFAQSHVIPSAGRNWELAKIKATLRVVGKRAALVLANIAQSDVKHPLLEAWRDGTKLGALMLNPPSALPTTESRGSAYATDRWSVEIPAEWMVPGTSFVVSADNYLASDAQRPMFNSDGDMRLTITPFYLFGANDTNSVPFADLAVPNEKTRNEVFAKWPFSSVNIYTHAARYFALPYLVVGPRQDRSGTPQPAYGITSMDQQKDGYGTMSAVLSMIQAMRIANGEGDTNNQYYAPIIALNAAGTVADVGGGLGGGNAGVGDYGYSGVFIHEQGHAFGLPHAAGAYADTYPYVGGSVIGSAWGYDQIRHEFLDVLVPSSASHYAGCSTDHQLDSQGRCFKQDPMQGGEGDQSPDYKFTMFSDFSAARLQSWMEGRILIDASSATGYSKWETATQRRVPYTPVTDDKGLYGANHNLPIVRDTKVNAIVVAFSRAGSAGASYIYVPNQFTGNLIRTFDPSNAADRDAITINTGTYPWYCMDGGCDYTLRVTYIDGSQILRVLQGGFREWFKGDQPEPPSAIDPLNTSSFRQWAINVPGDKLIKKIELLDTPMVWKGMPQNPKVLLDRQI